MGAAKGAAILQKPHTVPHLLLSLIRLLTFKVMNVTLLSQEHLYLSIITLHGTMLWKYLIITLLIIQALSYCSCLII